MAKLYAIAIREGRLAIGDVPLLWRSAAAAEYARLYGEEPR